MSDDMKVWVKRIREEASHVEEVLNKYFYHVVQQGKHNWGVFVVGSLQNSSLLKL